MKALAELLSPDELADLVLEGRVSEATAARLTSGDVARIEEAASALRRGESVDAGDGTRLQRDFGDRAQVLRRVEEQR